MKIKAIKLSNFRNYDHVEFCFSDYKNIIIGNNGMGKSNIVEAIYFLALTKSFRVNNDNILIKNGCDYATIEANVNDKINNLYKITIGNDFKKIKIDNNQVTKISDYISKIKIVLFSIEDLKMIKDSPSIHRKLFNMDMSIFNGNYLKLLTTYNKVLKQRNACLKQILVGKSNKDYLNIITSKLIDIGIEINKMRYDYIKELNVYLNDIFKKSVKKGDLYIDYVSQYNEKSKNDLLTEYAKCYNSDIKYGSSHIGIHLDDFSFMINSVYAKNYLSEGEQKTAVIAFKIAEIKYCISRFKCNPILILDDLFSELDVKKINSLIRNFNKGYQLFITTTDINNVNKKLLANCKVFKLTDKGVEVKNYE